MFNLILVFNILELIAHQFCISKDGRNILLIWNYHEIYIFDVLNDICKSHIEMYIFKKRKKVLFTNLHWLRSNTSNTFKLRCFAYWIYSHTIYEEMHTFTLSKLSGILNTHPKNTNANWVEKFSKLYNVLDFY